MCERFQPGLRLCCQDVSVYLFLVFTTALPVGLSAQQPTAAQTPAPTTWTSQTGVEVEADFVRMTDQAVVLKMRRDGSEATVPLTKLSIQSIYQAVRLAHPEEFAKPVPKAEVKPQVSIELPQLDLNVDEMLKSPFTANTTIDQFFQTMDRLTEEGNFFSGWHALPPKMQTDIEDLIIKGHAALGQSTVKQLQVLLNDLNTIARDKKQFILGLPEISANPQIAAQLEQHWPLVATLISGLAKDVHWQASNFQAGNVPRWLAQLNVDLAPPLMAGLELAGDTLPAGMTLPTLSSSHNIVSQTANSAEVEVTGPDGKPVKTSFQKVGNIWINVPAMNQLRDGLDAALEKLATGAPQEVGMIRTSLSGIIAAVGGLARANSQEEFNQAVDLLRTIGRGLNQSLGLQAALVPGASGGPGGPGRAGAGES